MKNLTLENLPSAVSQLNDKLEQIERLIIESKKKPENQSDKLLTIEEAAEFLHLSKATCYSKVSRGELPFMKMKRSKRLYFSRKELLEYLKEGRKKTNAEIEEEAHTYLKKKGGSYE